MSTLKAVNVGSYPKKSKKTGLVHKVYVYEVSGSPADIAAYKAAQAANDPEGRTEEQMPKAKNGKPLYWFVSNLSLGLIAEKTFMLQVTENGKIVSDNTQATMERDARIFSKAEDHQARILAEQLAGITATAAPVVSITNDTTPVAKGKLPEMSQDTFEKETQKLNQPEGAVVDENSDLDTL